MRILRGLVKAISASFPNVIPLSLLKNSPHWNNFCCLQLSKNFVIWMIQSSTLWTKNIPWKCKLKTHFTHVFNVISPLRRTKTSKCICFIMMERRHTVATSVATQASKLVIWKATCWFTVERSLLFVNSVTSPAQQLVTWRHTC